MLDPLWLLSPFAVRGRPSSFASSPAPTGFRWDFVTQNGLTVTQNGVPVVDLVRI